jgi:hypothetical protein
MVPSLARTSVALGGHDHTANGLIWLSEIARTVKRSHAFNRNNPYSTSLASGRGVMMPFQRTV